MENESHIPSFGENEELEFDVHEHDGKRKAINVTGPGGAPLKGEKFLLEMVYTLAISNGTIFHMANDFRKTLMQ